MKATPKELELHYAVKKGDDIALSRLYELLGNAVFRTVRYKFYSIARKDEALIEEAVNEAFYGYYKNPHTFDPRQCTLLDFLKNAAKRDLLNILQREKKHANRKDLPEDVELEEKFWNSIIESYDSTDSTMITDEMMNTVQQLLEHYFTGEKDIRLAKIVLSQDVKTEHSSEILEIEQLNIIDQRKQVKTHKDRINKVLERNDIKNKIKRLLQ
jgi:RNA polymerase sigma-70 factor (ECF subfamily)